MNRTPGLNLNTVEGLPTRPARRVVRLWSRPRHPVAPSHNGDCNLGRKQTGAIRTTDRAAWSAQRGPSCTLPAGRPGVVKSASLLDVSPHDCAGSLTGAGGFFVPSREDRLADPAVIARSGVAAPVVKMRVPVCKSPSFAKEGDT